MVGTVNSENFQLFINYLHNWLVDNNMFGKKDVSIILDNWSSHRSNNSIKTMKRSNMNIVYLPTYSPQFAPIELVFWIFKRKLLTQTKYNWIQLGKAESFNWIKSALGCLNRRKIKIWFKHFYKIVKDEIKSLTFSS